MNTIYILIYDNKQVLIPKLKIKLANVVNMLTYGNKWIMIEYYSDNMELVGGWVDLESEYIEIR